MGVVQPPWRRALPVVVALLAGVLVTGLAWWSLAPRATSRAVSRFDYDVPALPQLRQLGWDVVALAPDGSAFVYNTTDGLLLRAQNALEARVIPGSEEDLANPFFSPDGRSIAFWSEVDQQLKRIAVTGGVPVVIADVPSRLFGASWESEGTILFGQPDGIWRVSAGGGRPELAIAAEDQETLYGPQLLPGGDLVLFSVTRVAGNTRWDEAQIVVQSLSSGIRTVVIEGGSDARYLPTSHLTYALGDALLAVAFDVEALTVIGGALPVALGLQRATSLADRPGSANYGVSRDGTLVYLFGSGRPTRTLAWVDRQGRQEVLPVEPSDYNSARISPDGTRAVLDDRDVDRGLWVWDFARQTRTRLTVRDAGGDVPVWTPDSSRIAYDNNVGGIDWKAANNTGPVEQLPETPRGEPDPYFFTPDGRALVFKDQGDPETLQNIAMISLDEGSQATLLLNEPFNERNAELSPNGRWMAYDSDESGQYEIYVRPFPNVDDDLMQVSSGGGVLPLWSRDGRELFYVKDGSLPALMTTPVDSEGPALTLGAPTRIIDWPYRIGGLRGYDVSPDGARFLVLVNVGPDETSGLQLIVVQNWFEELRRLVPVN